MHLSSLSALLAVCGSHVLVSAAAVPTPSAPAPLPISTFAKFSLVKPLTLDEALQGANNDTNEAPEQNMRLMAAAAQCSNPRIRTEWDNYSASDRSAYVSAIKCLMGKPSSGRYAGAKNRYEDIVAVHQSLTPNVHSVNGNTNHKFLIWHRYYMWAFEDILRSECGFNRNLPWFDETRYAGRFGQSSIFSNEYFGAVNVGGQCVTNGKFAGVTLNIGPGPNNQPHCLQRNGDNAKTAGTAKSYVDACNARGTYSDMAICSEGGAHAWGHNGIGAVMQDTYASPSDPVFFLHHAFIDRNFRIWQNVNPARASSIDGRDRVGNPLTLDTGVSVNGLRPDVKIRDIIDTMGTKLCYKYNY